MKIMIIIIILFNFSKLYSLYTIKPVKNLIVNHYYNIEINYDTNLFPKKVDNYVEFYFPYTNFNIVFLSGNFVNWEPNKIMMKKLGGKFLAKLKLDNGKNYQYKFVTPIGWMEDPNNPEVVDDSFAGFNSVLKIDKNGNILEPKIIKIFDRKSESKNFILFTRTNDIKNEYSCFVILSWCESIFNYLTNTLNIKEIYTNKIMIRYRKQKSSNASAVTVGNIVTFTYPSFNYSIVTHELTHILAKNSANIFLSEGLATYIGSEIPEDYSLELILKLNAIINKLRIYIPLNEIFKKSNFILDKNVSILYTESGAFFKFMFDNYNKENIMNFYYSGKIEDLNEKSFEELEYKFTNYINKFKIEYTNLK